MKRFLTVALIAVMAVVFAVAPVQAEWLLNKYDSGGEVGYNFLAAGSVSGFQFVLDEFQQAAISATAGATMKMYVATGSSVITSGANSAGATTIVGTTASSASAFWNTTMSAGDLVVSFTGATDPNDQTMLVASFSSGSSATGTVKGLNAAVPTGTTLYRYIPATGNLAFEAPTVSKPIFILGEPFPPIADFTTTNYSMFPGNGISGPVGEHVVFESYSGATTTSPAAYLRGHYVSYK